MKNISLTRIAKGIGAGLARSHMTIFVVLIVGGLTGSVMLLNMILTESSKDSSYTSPIGGGSIDQTTLDRINSLHTSSDQLPEFTPPSGRINPFAE